MNDRQSLREYCRQCTDSQLRAILATERARASAHRHTPIGKAALVFVQEAQRELEKRGIFP